MNYKKYIKIFAKELSQKYFLYNSTDDLLVSDEGYDTPEEAENLAHAKRKFFKEHQGYYLTTDSRRINPLEIDYMVLKGTPDNKEFFKEVEFNEEEKQELRNLSNASVNMKYTIKISKRDDKEFNPEFNLKFKKDFNATNLAREIYALGYKTEKEIIEQFKERNYEVDADIKAIVKAIVDKQ